MTHGSLLNFIPPGAGWSSGVRTVFFLAGAETCPLYMLETWYFVCCICSDWKRGLADCSVVWRRKSWRSSTKERRRRWYIFSFTPVLVLFLSDQSIPCYLCVICLCVCVCVNPSGAAGVPSVPLAACARGSWGTVYWRLPPPAAVLDARMVR